MFHEPAAPLPEHVRLLAMHGVIAHLELGLAHAQGHAEHIFDETHDQARPDDVPADDEHGARDLVGDLDAVALDGAARVGEAEGGAAGDGGEDARGAAADEAGDEVGVEDAEDVVDVAHEGDFFGEDVHAQPGHAAGAEAEGDGAPAGDDAGGGGDGDEAADHAVDGADDGGFAVVGVVAHRPAQERHGGADVGVEDGDAGIGGGGVGIAAVEAVPADPEDTGADEDGEDVVGPVVVAVGGGAGADPPGADEAGGAAAEVDDVAAGVVDDAEDGKEAAAPDGVGDDGVGEGHPERHVQHPGKEVHAAEEGAGGDDEGDGGEDELEVDHGGHGEVGGDAGGGQEGARQLVLHRQRGARDAGEGQHMFAKSDLIGPDDPAEEHGGEGVEGHEGAVDGPFGLDDAGVEDHQAGDGLQADEGGGGELPGMIAFVEPIRVGRHDDGNVLLAVNGRRARV